MGKQLTVMGSGYVGLVASACFAELGNDVTVVDIDEDRVKRLQEGDVPIYEPGLEEIVAGATEEGTLRYTSDWEEALKSQEIIFIAVGTPKREDGSCDISYVVNAAEMIGDTIDDDVIVTTKSTVPVGTGELVSETIQERLDERFDSVDQPSFAVASNPEFLREGSAVRDFKNPDRVVIGSESEDAREEIAEIYEPLGSEIVRTGLRTAEMIKYASNAMLATKISFINEIANVSELVGADVEQVARTVGLDHRINENFLQAGVGYGGSCFPKDTEALVQIAGQGGYHSQILSAVMAVNQQQRSRFAKKILRHLPDDVDEPTVAVLGLSFKPQTDDMREAPSVDIIQELQTEGVHVRAFDPVAMENAQEKLAGLDMADSALDAVEDADAVALLTEWPEFVNLDYEAVKERLSHPIVFDGRNALPMHELIDLGLRYYGVGRGVDRLEDVIPSERLLEEETPADT